MAFSVRPYRRFPVFCPVTYHADLLEGHGTVWNISLNGYRMSGDLPLRVGQSFSLTVSLPDQESVFVAAGIVRWGNGDEYGVETLVADDETLNKVNRFVKLQVVNERTLLRGGSYGFTTAEMDSLPRSTRPPTPDSPSATD